MFEEVDPSRLTGEAALQALVALRAESSRLAALGSELLVRAAGATRVFISPNGREYVHEPVRLPIEPAASPPVTPRPPGDPPF